MSNLLEQEALRTFLCVVFATFLFEIFDLILEKNLELNSHYTWFQCLKINIERDTQGHETNVEFNAKWSWGFHFLSENC